MKAFVLKKYGNEQGLELKEIDKPKVKNDELLIKVHATSVNRTDCAMMEAYPFVWRFYMGLFKPRKNMVLGTEFAGEVVELGANVSDFKIGDRVFGFHDQGAGAHAEFTVVSTQKAVAKLPNEISYANAAVSLEGAHYAINFINKVKVDSNTKVMVNGASGGIGSAAVQLCENLGASISATCQNKDIELIKSLGATKVIDYTTDDFTKDNDQYDFVFDTVGKSTFNKCKPILKPGGIYISSELGPGTQNIWLSLFTPLTCKLPGKKGKKVMFPIPSDILGSLKLIKDLMLQSKFKPVIDKTYSFEQIPEAFSYVRQGLKTGNVSIKIQ